MNYTQDIELVGLAVPRSRMKAPCHGALLVALLALTNASCNEASTASDDTLETAGPEISDVSTSNTTATSASAPPPTTSNATLPPAATGSQPLDNPKPTTEAPGAPPSEGTASGPEPVASGSMDGGDDSQGQPEDQPDASDDPEPSDMTPIATDPDTTESDTTEPDTAEPGSADPDTGGPGEDASAGETFGPDLDGSCTASERVETNASGSGPYDVIVETNADPGIEEGTIFRPATLGAGEVFPIFVWGEGGCSSNGLSNAAAMAEIASHGYFVVADGTPNGSGSRSMDTDNVPAMGEPLLAYVDWALAENSKPCSAYYHALDATKIAANGFSCGGLMSTGTAGDSRITTWGSTSSGTFNPDQSLYDSVHTPVLIVEGGPSDIAYENGLRDYQSISALGHPIMFFSKDIGHGGDLSRGGDGDFTKINLAWLDWWLKGDETETGKGVLVGSSCGYCSDSEWEVMSANLP